jgi:hypothetical protein
MWMASPFGGYPPYVATHGQPPAPDPTDLSATDADRNDRTDRNDEVAAMRRELDELKQAIREGLAAKAPRKKRKP